MIRIVFLNPSYPDSYPAKTEYCSCRLDAISVDSRVASCVSELAFAVVAFTIVASAVGVEGTVGIFAVMFAEIDSSDSIEKEIEVFDITALAPEFDNHLLLMKYIHTWNWILHDWLVH